LERKLHQTILKATDDFQHFRFNTVIAALMELNNALYKVRESAVVNSATWNQALRDLLLMMAPIFPHIADELWHRQGNTSSVHLQRWPDGDPDKAREEQITVVVQIGGKVRDKLQVAPGTAAAELERAALLLPNIDRYLNGRAPQKVIVVPDKLVNFVV
jgi:leucyl-tRNA synthetase